MLPIVRWSTALLALTFCAIPFASAQSPDQEVDRDTARILRERLAIMVNNAITTNAFDDMLGSLSKVDRDRIAEINFAGYDRVNTSVARLRKSFRAAYGRDLVLAPETFSDVHFYADGDPDHAAAQITLSRNQSLTLHAVREGFVANRWRIDLTNPTAEILANALVRRLGTLSAARWPQDPAAGQRLIAQGMLEAILDARAQAIVQDASAK